VSNKVMKDETLSRRAFTKGALSSLLTISLLDIVGGHDLLASSAKPILDHWLSDMSQLARDLKDQKLKQVDWQKKVETLFGKLDVADFLKLIKFDEIEKKLNSFDEKGAQTQRVTFPKIEGVPKRLVFGRQMFCLKKGRSVVPHGHDNLATAFWILKGSFRGRHWERLEGESRTHMIIKSSIDETYKVGSSSTISDKKDNIHWYKALEDGCFIFNIHVMGINPKSRRIGRAYVDPNGEKQENGTIRAPRITHRQATELYG